MAERPDPRRFRDFAAYYSPRFAALYDTATQPRGKRANLDDIAEAEREHREAWETAGSDHASQA
jgi:hypothetical protein